MTPDAVGPDLRSSDLELSLLRALASDDDVVRSRSARAIGDIGRVGRQAVVALARVALVDGESGVRAAATSALNAVDAPPGDLLEVAIELLEHPDQTVRARAGWAIGKLDPTVAPAAIVPLCQRLAHDPAIDGRFGAAWAFGRMRSPSGEAIDALRMALRDAEADVRAEAVRAIGRTGPPAASTLPAVSALVDDSDPLVREQVAIAIGRLEVDAPAVRPTLRRASTDPVGYVRRAALDALATLGESAAGFDPVSDGPDMVAPVIDVLGLTDRLRGDDAFGRAEAAWMLAKGDGPIDDTSTVLLLTQALVDRDSDARWSAVRSIGRIGARSPQTTLVTTRVLRYDADPDVRQAAAAALAMLWPDAKDESIAALVHGLEDPDALVREDAAETLGLIGGAARSAQEQLEHALNDQHGGVRARAAWSLAAIVGA